MKRLLNYQKKVTMEVDPAIAATIPSVIGGGSAGDYTNFGFDGLQVSRLSAGGVLAAVEAVLRGDIDNAYCLVRPPGHHAEAANGMGFCVFNNVAIAALFARQVATAPPVRRVAVVDYDVHHGNGTEQCLWNDPDALFISLHQDNNYPADRGRLSDTGAQHFPRSSADCSILIAALLPSGGAAAQGTTINLPLPPGETLPSLPPLPTCTLMWQGLRQRPRSLRICV
jgi:hypothetical protein